MLDHLPSHGVRFVLNCASHKGTGVIVQLGDGISEFSGSLFLILVHMQHHRRHSTAYKFQQADNLSLQEIESPLVWPCLDGFITWLALRVFKLRCKVARTS
jgi:hypothetical protein